MCRHEWHWLIYLNNLRKYYGYSYFRGEEIKNKKN